MQVFLRAVYLDLVFGARRLTDGVRAYFPSTPRLRVAAVRVCQVESCRDRCQLLVVDWLLADLILLGRESTIDIGRPTLDEVFGSK